MSDTWTFPDHIPGWLSEAEGRLLARLAAGKRVLEIGSYCGRSTVCMAQTAAKVYALDWHKGDAGAGSDDTLDAFRFNTRDHRDKIVHLVGTVNDVGPILEAHSFDLVFVDGAHDYNSALRDIDVARQVVKPGGIIAMHDCDYPEIQRAARDVLGWDLTDAGNITDSLYAHSYGIAESDLPRVFVGMPTRNGFTPDALMATHQFGSRVNVVKLQVQSSSLLTATFNRLWCDALNCQPRPQFFCMLHDDIGPEPGWLDALLGELLKNNADLVAAVMPIKDTRGLSSTAVWDPATNIMRRLTVSECVKIGQTHTTFDAEQAGFPGQHILANTGCWVCRFDAPWVEEACFTIRDRNLKLPNGQWQTQCFSEDWLFSKWAAERGLKVMATTAVKAGHTGILTFPNHAPFGLWEEDQASTTLFDPPADESTTEMVEPLYERA